MRKRTLLYLVLLLPCFLQAANDLLRFRVYLTDKHYMSIFESEQPESTLILQSEPVIPVFDIRSPSMVRRQKQQIELDSTDYPINENYLKTIRDKGYPIVSKSHWMNTVVISAPDSTCLDTLRSLPFVKSVKLVWINPATKSNTEIQKVAKSKRQEADTSQKYGNADTQINMLNLEILHNNGFKGASKMIAILDEGFLGVDTMSWLKDLKMVAGKDFIYPPTNIYSGRSHGTSVLSVMAADKEFSFVGTAPDASYCLLRTEDNLTEYPIEEDYWAAAAEFADSIGADIITSSLGYFEFDKPELSYQKNELDGKTAFISQAANLAASKGILVVNSAGNEGARSWKKINFPADVENVLTVGAVMSDRAVCSFSSIGPTVDGRIKPDVMALGNNTCILNGAGVQTIGSGTSFSAPLIAGMAACIWDAFPDLTASELRRYIRESADHALSPDSVYGYGIPNAGKIMLSLGNHSVAINHQNIGCYPNPAKDKLYFTGLSSIEGRASVTIYNSIGMKMLEEKELGENSSLDISRIPDSIYLVEIFVSGERVFSQKVIIHK